MEEITRLMEDYADQQIATVVQLDAYERDRRHQTGELGANDDNQPSPTKSGHTISVEDVEGNIEL